LHLKLFSVLAALALTGALVYYSGGYDSSLLDSLLPGHAGSHDTPPAKAKRILKKYAKKRQPVSEEFTFFETLSDPALEKYVGLDGKIEGRRSSPGNSASTGAAEPDGNPTSAKPALRSDGANASRTLAPSSTHATASPDTAGLSTNNAGHKFTVQASSFKKFERAADLLKRLRTRGYPAYLSAFEPLESGGVWYRVFLGRFADRGKAYRVAEKARTEEGLTPMVVMDKE